MRRAVLALVATAVAVVLLASYRTHPPRQAPPRPPALRARPTATPTPVPGARTGRGPAVTTPYSILQVEADVKHGRLVGVRTIALTGDGPHTQALNARAEPILRREALKAGGAKIDVVSGATYTSESWIESLRAAMRAARG